MSLPSWTEAAAKARRRHSKTARPLRVSGRQLAGLSARAQAGGRASIDKSTDAFTGWPVVASPPAPDLSWRTLNLDSKTLSRISPARLLTLLADLSPDVSRALWDFLRYCNPGYEVAALEPGGEEQVDSAQRRLAEFIDVLKDYYGSFDIVLGRLFMGAFMRGAFFGELVLDEAGREPVDLATPDPHGARFRKEDDPVRGKVWRLGQWQGGQWVSLERDTIRYVPVDPFPGEPYGRPLVAPAVFVTLFLLATLHDIRRVLAQQGYPRLDIAIDTERLAAAMPADLESDPEAWKDWINEIIDEVETVYAALEPDDAYIHTDVVVVNRPVGTVDSNGLPSIDPLIRMLERQAVRALKTMPILFGLNETTTETSAIRQWEIYAAGIKSIQHLAETMLERLFGIALEAQGELAVVRFRFAELRASEAMRDAQTEAIQINNAWKKWLAGWISQDAASEEVTGMPADADSPRAFFETVALPETPEGRLAPGALTRIMHHATSPEGNGNIDELLEELRAARADVREAIAVSLNGREHAN